MPTQMKHLSENDGDYCVCQINPNRFSKPSLKSLGLTALLWHLIPEQSREEIVQWHVIIINLIINNLKGENGEA